jgi:hypothetical protein
MWKESRVSSSLALSLVRQRPAARWTSWMREKRARSKHDCPAGKKGRDEEEEERRI